MSPIFDIASTAKALHDTLDEAFATVPNGRTNVVMIDASFSKADGAAASILFAHKTESGWRIVTEGRIDQPHGLAGRVATIKSW